MKRIVSILLIALMLASASLSLCVTALADGDDKIVVVLDPGHGGKDVGAVGEKYEEYYNLKVAEYCAAKLRENGSFDVYLTRETEDEGLSLLERALIADEVNADVLVSMHFNGNTDEDMSGAYVYSSVLERFDLSKLAESTLSKISAASGVEARKCLRVKDDSGYYWDEARRWDVQSDEFGPLLSDYYGIITWGAKFGFPAMIIEHAFVTNEDDSKIINDDENLKKMGEADANALIEYFTGHEHVYGDEAVTDQPVSCVSAGKKSYHCAICGKRKDVTAIADAPDPEAHFWVKESETPATCVAEGSVNYYCRYERNLAEKGMEGVEDRVRQEKTPIADHDYELKSIVEPTEKKDGTKVYVCKVCGDTRIENITYEARQTELAEEKSANSAATYKTVAIVAICVAAVAVIAAVILAAALAKRRRATVAAQGDEEPSGASGADEAGDADNVDAADELVVEVARGSDAPVKRKLKAIEPNEEDGAANEALNDAANEAANVARNAVEDAAGDVAEDAAMK